MLILGTPTLTLTNVRAYGNYMYITLSCFSLKTRRCLENTHPAQHCFHYALHHRPDSTRTRTVMLKGHMFVVREIGARIWIRNWEQDQKIYLSDKYLSTKQQSHTEEHQSIWYTVREQQSHTEEQERRQHITQDKYVAEYIAETAVSRTMIHTNIIHAGSVYMYVRY